MVRGGLPDKVLICSQDDLLVVDQCDGPNWAGGCPGSLPGAAVACAGRTVIAAVPSGGTSVVLSVEPDATACPLASLELFLEGGR